jgi:hypothetical protein
MLGFDPGARPPLVRDLPLTLYPCPGVPVPFVPRSVLDAALAERDAALLHEAAAIVAAGASAAEQRTRSIVDALKAESDDPNPDREALPFEPYVLPPEPEPMPSEAEILIQIRDLPQKQNDAAPPKP